MLGDDICMSVSVCLDSSILTPSSSLQNVIDPFTDHAMYQTIRIYLEVGVCACLRFAFVCLCVWYIHV